jgi:molybdopterin molybdotransferase
MRTVADHQAAIAALLAPLASRAPESWRGSPPLNSLRVLAADVVAPIDLPPFTNSQMDGFAVRAAEAQPGMVLPVATRIAAGAAIGELRSGTAAPIMTGAPIPRGADAVIPIEAATPNFFPIEDAAATVSFAAATSPGTFVRRQGSDLAAGSLLLAAGTRLGAAQWGVLASAGVTEVPLLARVRVLVLSTGNELTAPGQPLASGRIYDANSASMAVALAGAGAEVTAVVVAPDDARNVRTLLAAYAAQVDLILTTGGVSKGVYEVVRDVFEQSGVEFVSVAMQPGGPQGFGSARLGGDAAVPVVAFPGNPVSALVSFEMFLRPVLRRLHGLPESRPALTAPLVQWADSPAGKHQVRRGRLTDEGDIELIGGPSSHLLHSYAASTLLVQIPLEVTRLEAGASVEAWRIDD